ncbi:MAG: glutamate 5-kinase [Gammaproteobacteria bacterium]|nr:MAG: glutamate 5-kinase [Gammaproteobacteria bacterium]
MSQKKRDLTNITARQSLANGKRWVVKIGSALITNDGRGLDHVRIDSWIDQLAALRKRGIDVVVVSSGAVAEGMQRLGWQQRPHALFELQAAAAVGQSGLAEVYARGFQRHALHVAQILLTHDDLSDRKRYLNARSTLKTLLDLGVIPVVNENDTVVTEEIRFGDNDSLAGMVANLIEADALLILTDQSGLCTADPRTHSDAKLIAEIAIDDPQLDTMVKPGAGALGRGGMVTKLRGARLAARSGAMTVIAGGREPDVIQRVLQGESLGTLLMPVQEPVAARKSWLAGHLQVKGSLALDDGAVKVLREHGSSLLAVGVTAVEGGFVRGDAVECVDAKGKRIALGLINYHADEASQIKGIASDKIEQVLGYVDEPELIHRDNLVLV